MSETREAILSVARLVAQAHGYNGLNFRDLGAKVGIRGASLHYHFASKADLGAAVARRYWEDTQRRLEEFRLEYSEAAVCLMHYPDLFRSALESDNRMCLAGFMSAEVDDLPAPVVIEVRRFADVHIAFLQALLAELDPTGEPARRTHRASAIFAAVAGAQLVARGRSDVTIYDAIVGAYINCGLIKGM